MTCKLCQERPVPANYGSPRRCAFGDSGVFFGDNWMCETMRELRVHNDYHDRCDDSAGAISVLRIPEPLDDGGQRGYIVLNYYKNRGRTDRAIVVNEDDSPELLTLDTAERTIRARWLKEGIVW